LLALEANKITRRKRLLLTLWKTGRANGARLFELGAQYAVSMSGIVATKSSCPARQSYTTRATAFPQCNTMRIATKFRRFNIKYEVRAKKCLRLTTANLSLD